MNDVARTAIDQLIRPRPRDLGELSVRRVLPHAKRRQVGPFVFFDHMGPVDFAPGHGVDVRPHPHICLATITYLFDGEIVHRDSLGVVQTIRPGEVNWMTAGRGIVHSERTDPERKARASSLHGLQLWIALPLAHEETAPSFDHYPADALPKITRDGAQITVIAGTYGGETSPVKTLCELFYIDAALAAGAAMDLPAALGERAVYVVDGAAEIEGQSIDAAEMAVLRDGDDVVVSAARASRIVAIGGAPLDGDGRHIWWNFVASSRERIERAKADWQDGRFASVPGDDEFIPLPEE